MKKHFYSICILSIVVLPLCSRDFKELYKKSKTKISTIADSQEIPYLLSIKNSQKNSTQPCFRLYYKGNIVHSDHDVFTFFAPKGTKQFDLFITTLQPPHSTTFSSWAIAKGAQYLHLQFTKTTTLTPTKEKTWSVSKEKSDKGCAIDQNALVLLLDPAYIDSLEIVHFKQDADIIPLPSLQIKPHMSLEQCSVKATLAAMDTDPFHQRAQREYKQEEMRYLSRERTS